jgi:hypothetical protein
MINFSCVLSTNNVGVFKVAIVIKSLGFVNHNVQVLLEDLLAFLILFK